jgi:hypothetical protein
MALWNWRVRDWLDSADLRRADRKRWRRDQRAIPLPRWRTIGIFGGAADHATTAKNINVRVRCRETVGACFHLLRRHQSRLLIGGLLQANKVCMGGSVVRLLEITLVTSLKVGGSNPVWENASTRFQQQNMMAIPGTGFVGMMQEMGRGQHSEYCLWRRCRILRN